MAVQNEQRRKLSWVESLIEARSGLEMRYNNVADYIPHNGCTAGLSSCLCNSQVKVIQSTSAVIVIARTHTHTHIRAVAPSAADVANQTRARKNTACAIRYTARYMQVDSYLQVRSEADASKLNLPLHGKQLENYFF